MTVLVLTVISSTSPSFYTLSLHSFSTSFPLPHLSSFPSFPFCLPLSPYISFPFLPPSLSSSFSPLSPLLQVWSCVQCSCLFHLQCIQQWVRDGTRQQTLLSPELFPAQDLGWSCPKCRHDYPHSQFPQKYVCFCGKQVRKTSAVIRQNQQAALHQPSSLFPRPCAFVACIQNSRRIPYCKRQTRRAWERDYQPSFSQVGTNCLDQINSSTKNASYQVPSIPATQHVIRASHCSVEDLVHVLIV